MTESSLLNYTRKARNITVERTQVDHAPLMVRTLNPVIYGYNTASTATTTTTDEDVFDGLET